MWFASYFHYVTVFPRYLSSTSACQNLLIFSVSLQHLILMEKGFWRCLLIQKGANTGLLFCISSICWCFYLLEKNMSVEKGKCLEGKTQDWVLMRYLLGNVRDGEGWNGSGWWYGEIAETSRWFKGSWERLLAHKAADTWWWIPILSC